MTYCDVNGSPGTHQDEKLQKSPHLFFAGLIIGVHHHPSSLNHRHLLRLRLLLLAWDLLRRDDSSHTDGADLEIELDTI